MMLTTAQVAGRLNSSVEHAQRLCSSGKLKATDISLGTKRPTWRVDEADLILYLNRHRSPAPVQRQRRKRRREVFDFIG